MRPEIATCTFCSVSASLCSSALVPARRAVRLPTPGGTESAIAAAISKVRDHSVSSSGRRLISGWTGRSGWLGAASGVSMCAPGLMPTSCPPLRSLAVP
jgi:hypothetical protein